MSTLKDKTISLLEIEARFDEGQYPKGLPACIIPRERFAEVAKAIKSAGARLVAEWVTDETFYQEQSTPPFSSPTSGGRIEGGSRGFGIYACYAKDTEYLIIKTYAPLDDPTFPSITKKFVSAYRFERQMRSLMGVVPVGHPDPRPWIKHENWPEDAYPLRKSFDASKPLPRVAAEYQFIKTEGEGV